MQTSSWLILLSPLAALIASGAAVMVILRANRARTAALQRNAPQDVSMQALPLPEHALPMAQELEGLGFQRLGEVSVMRSAASEPDISWVYRDAEGRVTAQISALNWSQRAVMVFTSYFADGAVVEAHHPANIHFEYDDYWSCGSQESAQTALLMHRSRVDEFRRTHGDPLPITTLAQYREHGSVFRERHLPRLLERAIRPILGVPVVGGVLGAVLLIVAVVLAISTARVPPALAVVSVLTAIAMLVYGFTAVGIINRTA
jgi:hypothetical protein